MTRRYISFVLVLILLSCTLLSPSSYVYASEPEQYGYIEICVNGNSKNYVALKSKDNLYLRVEDISEITGYNLNIGDWIAFSKEGNLDSITAVDIEFDGTIHAMGREYKIDIAQDGEEIFLPLNEMLYFYDQENERVEADVLTLQASDWQPEPFVAYKPVIYLYPEKETDVSVELTLDGRLTCTYPKYSDGWVVTAAPDGTLTDKNGQTYNYLYWEGETYAKYDMSKGFCVKGKDTAAFLEGALEQLGLTRREANEFIVYWLPQMEQNPYNIISFQTDAYTNAAELKVRPEPDTLIRVFMSWKKADSYISLPEQGFSAVQRSGFTVVEWGGTEIQ